MSLILVKNMADLMARGKNFADVFFDVFRRVVHDSALRLPNFSLVAKLSKLSTLSVRDCSFNMHFSCYHYRFRNTGKAWLDGAQSV